MEQSIGSEEPPFVKQLVSLGYIEERVMRMRHLLTPERVVFLLEKKMEKIEEIVSTLKSP